MKDKTSLTKSNWRKTNAISKQFFRVLYLNIFLFFHLSHNFDMSMLKWQKYFHLDEILANSETEKGGNEGGGFKQYWAFLLV